MHCKHAVHSDVGVTIINELLVRGSSRVKRTKLDMINNSPGSYTSQLRITI